MASFSGVRDPSLTWARARVEELDLAGKNVAVVGGTSGIGRALSQEMAARGARVWVVGQTFRDQGTPRIEFMKADLALMTEAVRIGRALPAETLDLLVLTTGIIAAPKREVTAEGIERDMAVSYLSRLALLREVGPRLGLERPKTAGKPRVFVMGFPGTGQAGNDDLNAERAYEAMTVHMNTVAGNEALVLDAAKRYAHASFFGLNPGLIKTNIRANVLGGEGSFRQRAVEALIGLFTMSAETYAKRTVPLLFAPELDGRSGAMFNAKGHAILPTPTLTATRVAAIIEGSEALVGRAVPSAVTA